MPGDTYVASLTRERRAGNMTGRAPESGLIFSFDNDHGETKARDFETSDQSAGRDSQKAWRRIGERTLGMQLAFETAAFPILENPGVRQDVSAVTQRQARAGEQYPPAPLQNLS
jgi:hypothetical protein